MKRNIVLIRILGGWLIGAILLIRCSSEDGQGISGDNLVRFNSQLTNVSLVSRSSDILNPNVLTKENWMSGDTIGVYMKHNDSKPLSEENIIMDNHRYLSTGDNVSTSIFIPATKEDEIYYPNLGIDFISYYPYKSTIGKGYLYPIEISNQRDPSKIDLLYAISDVGGLSGKGDVPLLFEHQLSKLVLNLEPDLTVKEVSDVWNTLFVVASGFYTRADFSLTDKVISNRDEIKDIIAARTLDGMRVELVLIPQTVEKNMYLDFRLQGNSGKLQWNIPEGKVFEAGKQYEYTVSIKTTWVEVFEGEIRPWEEVPPFDNIAWGTSSDTQYGLTKITGGEYYIGSPENVGEENEHPRHKVEVGSFWISSYEITNKQYAEFLNEISSCEMINVEELINIEHSNTKIKNDADTIWVVDSLWADYPVVNVTWHGARKFAQWLGGDLPTEAEWETACREAKNDDGLFSFQKGYEIVNHSNFVNYGQTSDNGIVRVDSLLPNAIKLYNMHGNVYEWCLDVVGRNAEGSPAPYNYNVSLEKKYYPIRGGSWKTTLDKCRSAVRVCHLPDYTADDIGFRVVFPISNVASLNFKELEKFLNVSSPLP
jgi:formylglycine-generating enzyme required for sulfatase activity